LEDKCPGSLEITINFFLMMYDVQKDALTEIADGIFNLSGVD